MPEREKCRLPETNDLKVKQTECSIKTGFSLCSYKLWIIVFSTCWLTLNTCYLFEGVGLSISEMHFASNKLTGFCRQFPFINNLPSPLPAAFLQGVDQQLLVMESQHPVFLINWYEKGFPAFYAICFFFKNPLHYIILLIVGGCYVFRNKLSDTSAWKYLLTGFFWSLLLFFIASLSTMQLGIRYILPVYPVVIMISSLCFQNFNHWSRPGKSLTVVTLMIATVISLWNRPHHLSYLNVLAGGVNEGYLILEDSNYDWGQDLYALEKYYKEHKIEKIYLAYFGTAPAEKLGINFELPPDGAPVPGWYAISTNLLTGRQYPLRKPDGKRDSGIQDRYFYMRFFTPVDKAGSSIFIYQLSEKDIKHWKSEVEKYRTTMY